MPEPSPRTRVPIVSEPSARDGDPVDSPAEPDRRRGSATSYVITFAFAMLPANFVPPIIGELVGRFGVSLDAAGLVATLMTLANAVVVLSLEPVVARGHRVLVARSGVAILMLAYLAVAFVPDTGVILTALVVGGLGSGCVISAATAAVARTPNPDATTTAGLVVNRIVVALAYFVLPLLGARLEGIAIMIAVVGVVALIGAARLSPPLAGRQTRTGETAGGAGLRRSSVGAWVLALGFAVWTVTEEGTYALLDIFYAANVPGLDETTRSVLYGAAVLAGLAGALVAPLLLRFVGRVTGLSMLLALSIVSKVLLATSTIEWVVITVSVLWGFAFGAAIPLVFGLAARITANGSASVLVNGVYMLGVAAAPFAATQLAGSSGLTATGAILGAIALAAALVVVLTVRALESRLKSGGRS